MEWVRDSRFWGGFWRDFGGLALSIGRCVAAEAEAFTGASRRPGCIRGEGATGRQKGRHSGCFLAAGHRLPAGFSPAPPAPPDVRLPGARGPRCRVAARFRGAREAATAPAIRSAKGWSWSFRINATLDAARLSSIFLLF